MADESDSRASDDARACDDLRGAAERSDSVGAWAKHYYLTLRALMDSELRDSGLGPTQWYALWQLVNVGPTLQRDLSVALRIERATLSGIVTTLVRKGLIEQTADGNDQRQRLLTITDTGRALWATLPNPVALAHEIAFADADPAELAIARKVLVDATQRLLDHLADDSRS